VFSHLLALLFSLLQDGDFISQRRYKGDTYAIPYAGEEVMLHWANKDQYYTKSGENFANYSFKLEDGRKVHFRLVAADTAKDNRKDNDKERRFALVEPKTVTRIDEQGDEVRRRTAARRGSSWPSHSHGHQARRQRTHRPFRIQGHTQRHQAGCAGWQRLCKPCWPMPLSRPAGWALGQPRADRKEPPAHPAGKTPE
jgi:hypothetical protein